MLKNKIKAILLASVIAMFASCSDDDQKPDIDPPVPPIDTIVPPPTPPTDTVVLPPVEPISPVDFNFITLNWDDQWYNGTASISYIKKDGSVILDYFNEANGGRIAHRPNSATQIEDKLYIVQQWRGNNIEILNPNSFKRLRKIELNDISIYDLEHLGGDSVAVVGQEDGGDMNFILGNLKTEEFSQRSFNTGFRISRALKIGDKLIVGGTMEQSYPDKINSKLAIFDIDDLSQDGMRIIHDKMDLFNQNSDFLVDKHGNIWFIANNDGAITCFYIDPKTEAIVQEIELPATITSTKDLSYTLDNTGSILYIRSHKAFFYIDTDSPLTPDEPIYEYMEETNVDLVDLKMTKDGTLLVINRIRSSGFKGSKVLEFRPSPLDSDEEGDWEIVKRYDLPNTAAASIYVARYEK